MDRHQAENMLDTMFGLPTGSDQRDEMPARQALREVFRSLGAQALSEEGLERLVDEQKAIFLDRLDGSRKKTEDFALGNAARLLVLALGLEAPPSEVLAGLPAATVAELRAIAAEAFEAGIDTIALRESPPQG